MKCMKVAIRAAFCLFSVLCLAIFASLIYLDTKLSDSYKISQGESLKIESNLPLSISYSAAEQINGEPYGSNNTFDANIKVFGLIPAGNITVNVVDDYYVEVLGTPFGIKIYTEGVLVVGFSEVKTASGSVNPAKSAGIREGDFIVSLNGTEVYTNEEVMSIIKNSMGQTIVAKTVRSGKTRTVKFKAALDNEGVYRAGMWVKDSSAGIGTLTFYSPVTNVICGLGHPIADSQTDTLLTLNRGEFVSAKIISVEKGTNGEAGELKGRFTGQSLSSFELNCENGVYGQSKVQITQKNMMKIAMKQEVKNGEAQILCTVEGDTPQYYSCNIKVKSMGSTQNLYVEVTDSRLLEKTGGIVQGMSGSPIIQNGKLIGAVTHVLIDNSKCGYGIFAETMLESAQSVAENKKLKEAS